MMLFTICLRIFWKLISIFSLEAVDFYKITINYFIDWALDDFLIAAKVRGNDWVMNEGESLSGSQVSQPLL